MAILTEIFGTDTSHESSMNNEILLLVHIFSTTYQHIVIDDVFLMKRKVVNSHN